MTDVNGDKVLGALEILVGEWSMAASLATDESDGPHARTTFEWLPGRHFLIQRWEVDHPDAPDGIAIIGFDPASGNLRQNYFDSRGVARVYAMTFVDRVWTLERRATAPDFSQRFSGTLAEDGNTISGRWDISQDGSTWNDDFGLVYKRLR